MKKLPHYKVYARLAPSKIHGVGVITIAPIKKGTYIFYGDEATEIIWIKKARLKDLPKEIMGLYNDFCIIKDKGQTYGCPQNFNLLTISWYLNHSESPNVICDKNYNFHAARDIKKGEELTVNYDTFSE